MREPDNFYLYRVEDRSYSTIIDADREEYGSATRIELIRYLVLKRTPQGWWVQEGLGGKRYVKEGVRNGFARPTVEDAVKDYQARKERQWSIHQARADRAKRLLAAARHPAMVGDLLKFQQVNPFSLRFHGVTKDA